jgi:hypothetical protein
MTPARVISNAALAEAAMGSEGERAVHGERGRSLIPEAFAGL